MKHLYALFLVVALFMGCTTQVPAQTQAVDSATYTPNFELGKFGVPFAFDRTTGGLIVVSKGIAGIQRTSPTVAATVAITAVNTQSTGTSWAIFPAAACEALDIVNTTTVDIEYRRGGAGHSMTIPAGGSRLIIGITNANQISIRRVDTTNDVITIKAETITP